MAGGIVLGYAILEVVFSLALNIDSLLRSPVGLAIFLFLALLSAFMGALIGKRRQLLNYIDFLLKSIPRQDRQMFVDRLYREVASEQVRYPERSDD